MIADAVMACWGMDKWITTTYPYDEKDFKRIDGLTVLEPEHGITLCRFKNPTRQRESMQARC
jgi:hypothetical protein